jgi:hypothetical protein
LTDSLFYPTFLFVGARRVTDKQREKVITAKLRGATHAEAGAAAGISQWAALEIWNSPKTFAILARQRAVREPKIGAVLDQLYDSLLLDFKEAPKLDLAKRMQLRLHTLEVLERGEPKFTDLHPPQQQAGNASASDMTWTDILVALRGSASPSHLRADAAPPQAGINGVR